MASVPNLDGYDKAYNAEFQGAYGLSLHGTDGSRWFLGDDGTRTLLHPTDIAALMEFGQTHPALAGAA